MKSLSIIVAVDTNLGIGLNNQLLCHLPADLKHFKTITSGHTVLMGRNTYLSLPKGALPNRKNIVINNIEGEVFTNCLMASSIEDAIAKCDDDKENFIMGGAMIYKQFMPIATKLYLTRIQHIFNADTFFPIIDPSVWTVISSEYLAKDEKNQFDVIFETLVRK